MTPEPYLSAKEAASLIGVCSKTLANWSKAGKIASYPIGYGERRIHRYRASDIHKFMEKHRKEAA